MGENDHALDGVDTLRYVNIADALVSDRAYIAGADIAPSQNTVVSASSQDISAVYRYEDICSAVDRLNRRYTSYGRQSAPSVRNYYDDIDDDIDRVWTFRNGRIISSAYDVLTAGGTTEIVRVVSEDDDISGVDVDGFISDMIHNQNNI